MKVTTAISMLNLDVENESSFSDELSGEEALQTVLEIHWLDLGEVPEKSDVDPEDRDREPVHETDCPQHGSVSADAQNEIRRRKRIVSSLELLDPENSNVLWEGHDGVPVTRQPLHSSTSRPSRLGPIGSPHDHDGCSTGFDWRSHRRSLPCGTA
jgi:hypothetical protein